MDQVEDDFTVDLTDLRIEIQHALNEQLGLGRLDISLLRFGVEKHTKLYESYGKRYDNLYSHIIRSL